ncbi:uncharacterized protein [Chironomus tepperi]|uniref:uncharacterized protein n=1 Tax=Chironomus tepperi TaxID=113505 RepID=UPI00391F11E6
MTSKDNKNYFQAMPWEILENIFSHLKSSKQRKSKNDDEMSENTDLKSAMLVCRRFNEVISTSKKLMESLILQIVDCSLDDLECPLLIRRYRSCDIYKLSEENFGLCLRVLRNYGPHLKVITFHGTFPENRMRRMSLLNSCRNIEELRLFNITGTSLKKIRSMRNVSYYDFPNLKSLSIIDRPQHEESTLQIVDAFSFVNIESLAIYSKGLFILPIYNEWKIRKLDVGKVFDIPNFIRFLHGQKPYIRELSIHFCTTILEYIMREMNELTMLKLQIDFLPDHLITNNLFEKNTSLKNLTIKYTQLFMRTDFIQLIFKHYLKIESLTLDFYYGGWAFTRDDSNDIMLKDLKHLSLNSNSNFVFLRGQFPKLQSLHVDYFRGSMIYTFPCLNYLERLSIKISSFKISLLANFYPNLKYLSIEDGTDISEREMYRIISKLPKLKVLKIKRYMWRLNVSPIDFLTSLNQTVLNVIFQDN